MFLLTDYLIHTYKDEASRTFRVENILEIQYLRRRNNFRQMTRATFPARSTPTPSERKH